eukprot:gene4053-6297_t
MSAHSEEPTKAVCYVNILPDDALLRVTYWLCLPAIAGEVHPLSRWRKVCRRWQTLLEAHREVWMMAWAVTRSDQISLASLRFAASVHKQASPANFLHSSTAFLTEMKKASTEASLELGLIPGGPPKWCKTSGQVEDVLRRTVVFCSFEVSAARAALQCTRGSIPVIESATVLASVLHVALGGLYYLRQPVPPPLQCITRPMLSVVLSWVMYVFAYGVYRSRLMKIHHIPEEARKLWKVRNPKSKSKLPDAFSTLVYLIKDGRIVGALAWVGCLLVSVVFWHLQTSGLQDHDQYPYSVNNLLISIFAPPTFAATLVAWQRSGGKLGLLAGFCVACTICLLALFPGLLFVGLGGWAASVLLRIHRGYYRAPRTARVHLLAVSRKLGQVLVGCMVVMSGLWFVSLEYFLRSLVLCMTVLASW